MIEFFHQFLYVPIYNLLVFLVGIMPGGDIGLSVIVATLIVKIIIMPLSLAAVRTQKMMKIIEPKVKKIQEELKDDKEKQARELFAVYKKYKIKPLASFLTLLIQIPILISLYWVFSTEILPQADLSLLYSFVHLPASASPLFLGLFPVAASSIALALIAGLSQLVQAYVAIPLPPAPSKDAAASMQAEFGRALALQARFIIPILIGVVAYTSGAIALYFITSNIVMLLQEFIVRQGKLPELAEEDR
ncbi:MAG: YidC/Oxa1 family membrane protein insertase [Parcubacteria bacterium C7867-001]|nr:MAG: YidC/Oxa1 family membrane protein insertase [Parcubacteria bacterium C7867-001]